MTTSDPSRDREHVAYVDEQIDAVHRLKDAEPAAAAAQVRKATEAMLRHLHAREIAEPGKMMIEQLMVALKQRKVLPERIVIQVTAIQTFGNYAGHAQADFGRMTTRSIQPALLALDEVAAWYRRDYLAWPEASTPAAKSSAVSTSMPQAGGRRRVGWIAAIALVAALVAVAAIVTLRDDADPSTPPTPVATVPIDAAPADALPPAVDAASAADAGGFEVVLSTRARRGDRGASVPLEPGGTLHTGDSIQIEVSVSEPLHVYLLARQGGTLTALFPSPAIRAANPLKPERALLLPERGDAWLVNKDDLGDQEIFVVASREPQETLEVALRALEAKDADQLAAGRVVWERLGKLARQPACGTDPAARAPSCRKLTRGFDQRSEAINRKVSMIHSSEPGADLLVATFPFIHEP